MCVCDSHDVYYDVNIVSPPLQPFDFRRESTSEHLVYELQTTANRLSNAYDGVDVRWIDSGTLATNY